MGRLAAVTAWFNPNESQERFAARLQFTEAWTQQHEIYLHLIGQTVFSGPRTTFAFSIWQKERLLNLAIRQLPPDVDKVIWIDADLEVISPTWTEDVLAALDTWPIIQPWSTATFFGPEGLSGGYVTGPLGRECVPSVPCANIGRKTSTGLPPDAWPGFCWAARREVLEEIGGLYEHDLSGPNDVLMSLAFYGDFNHSFLLRYNGKFREHYMRWAERTYAVVQGNVGFVPATLTHLWHGPFEGRKYLERTVRLMAAGYDPGKHVTTAPDGSLMLTDDCPWEVRKLAAAVVEVELEPPRWESVMDARTREEYEHDRDMIEPPHTPEHLAAMDRFAEEVRKTAAAGGYEFRGPLSDAIDSATEAVAKATGVPVNVTPPPAPEVLAAAERFIHQQTQAALSDGCCDKPVDITVG